ncbi:SMP-30/gluconolactonase/LRE family protein [Blastococcus goldschmidtiae]|uniref:SMP-30/gluconolactonase/LRE family protein n=1 Tax=Blastococcus goldschmidtiae TaxID=3075546 RepID=A0ABU2K7K7_9ACTN|nr:SMP-30/gluconolactonase/LRE family protein [Blastococcus sp. DSM 46792]MDT0276153.1 SMP-30/gluconolactonase/LRE family protein [Blastococcus sp. DSM 46792]
MHAEQVTDPVAYHGEGPVWSPSWGGLRWVDMLAGDVLSLAEDGAVGRRHVSEIVAAVRPRRSGGAVLGIERGFALEDADGTLTRLLPLWDDEGLRMNEGGCDPDGRFYCGSMAYDQRPGAAALHRLEPDGATTVVVEGVTVSNGLAWSPDGSRAYYDDTATHRVDVFDYDTERGLHGRRPFAEIPDGGLPDGLAVDEHGGVWVALADRGEVWRFSGDGVHDGVVEVPVGMVTACTFGGADLDQLFITTSRENLPPAADPLAGSLFRADVGVRGLPVREFAG